MAKDDEWLNLYAGKSGSNFYTASTGHTPRVPKNAHLVNLDTFRRCLRFAGIAADAGSANEELLRMVVEEFNRAQNALRDEMKEMAMRMCVGATEAETAEPVAPTPPQSSMRSWQCAAATCIRAKYTGAKPPTCYTCGSPMSAVGGKP